MTHLLPAIGADARGPGQDVALLHLGEVVGVVAGELVHPHVLPRRRIEAAQCAAQPAGGHLGHEMAHLHPGLGGEFVSELLEQDSTPGQEPVVIRSFHHGAEFDQQTAFAHLNTFSSHRQQRAIKFLHYVNSIVKVSFAFVKMSGGDIFLFWCMCPNSPQKTCPRCGNCPGRRKASRGRLRFSPVRQGIFSTRGARRSRRRRGWGCARPYRPGTPRGRGAAPG